MTPRSLSALLRIDPAEASLEKRGFRTAGDRVRAGLEGAGRAFIRGYNGALGEPDYSSLEARLQEVPRERRGFAFEGAAMASRLLDLLFPWGHRRFPKLLEEAGDRHVYMLYVGAGWAHARTRRIPRSPPSELDPLLVWLLYDGAGFHEGYFRTVRFVADGARPRRLHGYATRAFDQGLGRSLWFACGGDPRELAGSIGRFPASRRPDLWSGAGLACAYAGGADLEALRAVRRLAGAEAPALAQGAAFAATARQRAGLDSADTDLAVRILCGRSVREAADITRAAAHDVRPNGPLPAYEMWRSRIRAALAPAFEAA